jgi:hypothetical protein
MEIIAGNAHIRPLPVSLPRQAATSNPLPGDSIGGEPRPLLALLAVLPTRKLKMRVLATFF